MEPIKPFLGVLDGLVQDPTTKDFQVLPGYSQQVLRYSIRETWLDEDDRQWIAREAVERERRLEESSQSEAA